MQLKTEQLNFMMESDKLVKLLHKKEKKKQDEQSVRVACLISISNQPEETSLCEPVIFLF